MKCPFTPTRGRLIVRPDQKKEKTPGGILLPDTAQKRPVCGLIVAVGEPRLLESGEPVPQQLWDGLRVYYDRYVGTEIELEGETYLVLNFEDVLCTKKE